MANFCYTRAKRDIALGDIHLDTDDIRVLAVMTDTTADTEEDKTFLDQFTTLDEFDGAGYSRGALANEAVNEDTANDRAEFAADNLTFSSISAGTRNIQGIIVYKHVTDDTDSIPLFWIEDGGFPFTANGGDLVMAWNAQGIAQVT